MSISHVKGIGWDGWCKGVLTGLWRVYVWCPPQVEKIATGSGTDAEGVREGLRPCQGLEGFYAGKIEREAVLAVLKE